MSYWSYNGCILADFPTDFGDYTGQYPYCVISWYQSAEDETRKWFNALASTKPFVKRGEAIYAAGYYGNYYTPEEETAWNYVGNHSSKGIVTDLSVGGRLIWANHDVLDEDTGEVYLAASEPVDPDSTVTAVTVEAEEVSLVCGQSLQLAPQVHGTGSYSRRVTYTLSGNDSHGGTTLSDTGLLSVGAGEYASSFTVTIASRQDPAVFCTVTVRVTDYRRKLTATLVTDLYDCNGEFFREFPTDFGDYTGQYPYRVILWYEEAADETRKWYNALASTRPFVKKGDKIYAAGYYGNYYTWEEGGAWNYVGNQFSKGAVMDLSAGGRLIWADHDVLDEDTGGVYLAAGSEPEPLCRAVSTDSGTEYHLQNTEAYVDLACTDLNAEEAVYTVCAWLYRQEAGLDTTLPPSWTGPVFAGPDWSYRLVVQGLEADTDYGLYTVVCAEGVPTDHNALVTFSCLPAPSLQVEAAEVRGDGFTLSVVPSALEEDTVYTAEVLVYFADSGRVVAEALAEFTGNSGCVCLITGLEPETEYAVSVDVYPTRTGEIVVRGDYTVSTGPEALPEGIFAGVGGLARPIRAIYAGVNGRARAVRAVYLGVDGRAQPLKGG